MELRMEMLFQLACLAFIVTLAGAHDVQNIDKDCSVYAVCTKKILLETRGVCGSDGNFYPSFCDLEVHNCKSNSPTSVFALEFRDSPSECKRRRERRAAAMQSGGKTALFQNVNVNWQTDSYRRDGLSDILVTMNLMPDTGTDSIYGNRLWRMGLYASDSPQGTGVKHAYQSNVLDATAMQTPLRPPRAQGTPPPLTLEGQSRFDLREICEIRNKHPYFCVEFAKNDASSVQFSIPIQGGVIKVCSPYTCPESAGQGPLARISDFSAAIDPYSVESSGNADLRITLNINPAADTESISGSGLWRVGVFASNDARGESRYHEDRNILDSRSERSPMYPSRAMALTGSTTFPVAVLGCRYRYLCIEFAKGDRPSTEFNMQSTVSCQPKNCEATGGNSRPNPSNPSSSSSSTARYSRVSARTQPYQMDSNGDASITMTLVVTPTADTDRIRGTDLWRVGVFASNDARGNSRYLENRNILDSYASRETMYPSRDLELTGTFDFRAGDLGCRYQYLCIEYAKGDRPSPDFEMQSSVSCQAQQCQQPPAPEPEPNPNPSTSSNRGQSLEARYSSFSARTDPYTMDSNGDANIRMTLTVDPTADTDSITGYDLWRVGVFASSDDRGRRRYNEVRNILDTREARQAMYARRSMDLTGNFDFPAGDLGCRYQYLCVEFAKGDNPSTEFSMQPSVSCTPQQCRQPPAPEPEPNPSTNQGQGLVARYSSFSAEADPYTMDRNGDANIRMTLSVQTAVDTDTVRGNGLWRVGVFASNDNMGRGTRYNENRNILDNYEARETMYPRRTMELSGNLDFPAGDLGCRYRYLCVELDKGERPSVEFVMQPSVSCTEQQCQQPTSPDSNSNPNPNTNTNTNSNYERPDAIYSSVSAVTDEYTVDSNGDANIRMTLSVNPTANTDTIEGSDLWRLGVFASNDPRGSTRYQEIPNILDQYEAQRSMYPRRRMDLAGTFDFPAGDLGCRYQYLCVEFAKGLRPSMDFTMESTVSCQPQVCQETTEPHQPTSTGPVARYNQFTAAIEPYEIQTDSSAQMELSATVNPSSSTDYIAGDGLWRIGVFASNDNRGRTRYHENRNVIGYADARQNMRAGRPLELSGSLSFPAAGYLGCQFNFLCIEFDKGESPSVEFEMEPYVSCERQQCGGATGVNTGGSPSVTSGGGGNRNPNRGGGSGTSSSNEPTVELHSLSWTAESQAIRADGTTNLIVEASVGMGPSPSPFGGGGASNLWRMGIFTSSSPDGSDRYSESEQILSGMDRYKQVRADTSNTFSSTTNFNVRNLGCSPTTRYLCLEFGMGTGPTPSYTVTGGNTGDNSMLTCKRQECDQDPSIRVIGVRPSVVELREGERNPVTFDVNVRYEPVESTRIQGSNLWKLQAFGSKSPEGTGPETSFSDQVLGAFQEDTLFDPSSEFGFQDVSHTIDLTGRRCPEVKFLCVRLQKDTPYPDFRLLSRNDDPNNLVGCTKFTCVARPRPMVVVTALGVVRSPYGSVRSEQSNQMTLEINVNHDRSASTDVAGDPGWAVEAWGSSKKNGKGRKVSPRTLDLGYDASRPFDVSGTLRFGNVPYDYDLRGSTCAKARFLCAKLSKTRADFALKGRPSKALIRCTPVPCSNADGSASQTTPNRPSRPGRPVGGGPPQVRLASMRADFGTVRVNPTGNSNMDLTYYVTASANSDVPAGKGLWHLGVYLSDQVDGSGSNRYAYTGNVLTPKQAKTPISPGREVAIEGIGFEFPVSEIGCYPYYYLCLEFGKGTSTNYEMATPATGRMVSCDRQTCQS